MGLNKTVVSEPEIRRALEEQYHIGDTQRVGALQGVNSFCYRLVTPRGDHVLKEMLIACDHYAQYYQVDASGKAQALDVARWSTSVYRWLEAHGAQLSDELSRAF